MTFARNQPRQRRGWFLSFTIFLHQKISSRFPACLLLDNDANEVEIINELVSTRSTIELPLQNNANQTQFKLYKSYDLVDSTVVGNPDIITVTYAIETLYISRACGYINNYEIQTFSISNDSERWMTSFEILTTQITNENEIHVKILH